MNELEFKRKDKLRSLVLDAIEDLISLHEKWVIWNQIGKSISMYTEISSSGNTILDNLMAFSDRKALVMETLIRNLDRIVNDE